MRGSTVIIDGNGWIFSLLQRPQAQTIMVSSLLKEIATRNQKVLHCSTNAGNYKLLVAQATPEMLKGLFPRDIPLEPLCRTDGGNYDLLDLRVKSYRRASMCGQLHCTLCQNIEK